MKRALQREHQSDAWSAVRSAVWLCVVWLGVMSLTAGCATAPLKVGERAAAQGQWEIAIAAYEQAARQHPEDRVLALKVQLFKQRAAFVHMDRGEQLVSQQRRKEALVEFQRALELYPTLDSARARTQELQRSVSTIPRAPAPGVLGETAPSPGPQTPGPEPSRPPQHGSEPGGEQGAMTATTVISGSVAAPESKEQQTPVTGQELPPSGAAPLVTVQPQQLTAQVDQQITVQVNVVNVVNLFGAPFYLGYDPARLDVVSATEGGFLNNDGQSTVFLNSIDSQKGQIIIGLSRLGPIGGVSGSGTLATITFRAKAAGPVTLTLQKVDFRDALLSPISVLLQPANIQIEGS